MGELAPMFGVVDGCSSGRRALSIPIVSCACERDADRSAWGTITGRLGLPGLSRLSRNVCVGSRQCAASMSASFNLGVANARDASRPSWSRPRSSAARWRAERGRFFHRRGDQVGRPAYVAVVSHAFWRGEMEQNPDALGKTLAGRAQHIHGDRCGARPLRRRGVTNEPDLWLPMSAGAPRRSWETERS